MDEKSQEAYLKPRARSYVWSYLANLLVIGASFLSYRLSSHFMSEQDFAIFAISKRIAVCGAAIVATGWGVSLAYHVAQERSREGGSNPHRFFILASKQITLFLLLLLGLVLILPRQLSLLLLGDKAYGNYLIPLLYDFLATSAQGTLTYYFLGLMQIRLFSLVSIICSAFIPLLGFFLFGSELNQYFVGKASLTILVTLIFYLSFARSVGEAPGNGGKEEWGNLLSYAAVRMPGAFLVSLLLILPVTLSTHTSQALDRAAALSIGMALVGVVAAGVTPVSNLFLPRAAYLKSQGKAADLRGSVLKVCWIVALLSVLYIALLTAFLEPFMTLLLGKELTGFENIIREALPAALPYALFRCFYGLLDGACEKPLATYNALVSVLIFTLVSGFCWWTGKGDPSIVGFLASTFCLGGISVSQTFWVLRQPS